MAIEPARSTRGLLNRRLAYEAAARRGPCKWCESVKVVRNGKARGQQRWRCKDCGHQFFDNGKYPRMRKSKDAIDAALKMYRTGSSLTSTARNLRGIRSIGVEVHWRTIHRWMEKYVPLMDDFLVNFTPKLSGLWYVDETVLKFRPSRPPSDRQRRHKIRRPGEEWWQWDGIDDGTRFLIGTRISKTRTFGEGYAFLKPCADLLPDPYEGHTDSLAVYRRLFKKIWGGRVKHVASDSGFRPNQPVERFHGTVKDRIRPMRGLKSPESPIPRLIAIDYNFLRPHTALDRMTPARAAGIELPLTPNDGWGDLIGLATRYQTLREMARRGAKAKPFTRAVA